jgi:ADP-ribose pyrophosphatase
MEILAEGRFLRLVRNSSGWEWVERTNAKGVVVVAAVTDAGEVLFVEQFRPPVGRIVVEFPAGLVGDEADPDESGSVAALRELVEETGFSAKSIEFALEGPSSAGMSRETLTMYIARGLTRIGAGGGVSGEDITAHLVPLASAHDWLAGRVAGGAYVDPKVYAGLYLLARG